MHEDILLKVKLLETESLLAMELIAIAGRYAEFIEECEALQDKGLPIGERVACLKAIVDAQSQLDAVSSASIFDVALYVERERQEGNIVVNINNN